MNSYLYFFQDAYFNPNKNECEIRSKMIVSQDYFDYRERLKETICIELFERLQRVFLRDYREFLRDDRDYFEKIYIIREE